MKLLFFQPRVSYYVGGGELVPISQMIELKRRGHEIHLITTKTSRESEYFRKLKHSGINVYEISETRFFDRKLKDNELFNFWKLESFDLQIKSNKLIKLISPDLSIFQHVLDLKFITNHPMVLHLHGIPDKRINFYAAIIKKVDLIISVSENIRESWRKLYPEFKRKINIVIKNGIDTDFFKPKRVKKIYDILYVGRLIKIKGVEQLIRSQKNSKLKLLIIGDGPEKQKLMNLSRKLNVNAKFMGYVKSEKLPYLYSKSKIAVFPSLKREGIITSMLEAMSCGVPVVTTTGGSMNEAIDLGGGLIVQAGDTASLSKGINYLLDRYINLTKVARNNIINNFSIKRNINEIEMAYLKLVSSK
ncbi:MAG: glycosyltransferase family 4 protein [Caldisphaera sp.]